MPEQVMAQKHVEQDPFADDEGFAGDDEGSSFTDDSHHQDGFSSGHDDDDQSTGFDEHDSDTQGFDAQVAESDSTDDGQVAPLTGQPKPFLKSPLGIAVMGLATLGVVGIGVAGYRSTQGHAVEDDQGSRQVASTKAEVPAGEVDFGAAADNTVAGEAREVIHNVAPVNAPKTAAQVLNMAQPVVEPVEPAHAPTPTPTPVVATAISPELLAEHDALKKRVEEQQATNEELTKSVTSINQALARLSAVVEKNGEDEILLGEQVKAISDKLEVIKPTVAPVAPVVTPEAVNAEGEPAKVVAANVNPKVEGRVRVPGLKVLDSTASGHMVVIKRVSNGRVYTMFEGELINTPKGQYRVNEVLDNGTLLLIGEKYYIDTTVDEESEGRRAPQAKPQPEPKKVVEAKREAPAKPVQDKPKVVKSSVMKNYTLNAVYGNDNDKSFGVVTNNGDFKTFKVGENVQGVGVVEGLDSDGNLKVGNFVIESVY
jgi:hypothetical protein